VGLESKNENSIKNELYIYGSRLERRVILYIDAAKFGYEVLQHTNEQMKYLARSRGKS